MEFYNYNLYKNKNRTLKENNFVKVTDINDKCIFFDFTNLTQIHELSEAEIKLIKTETMKWATGYCTSFISGKIFNKFHNVTIDVSCNQLRVFDKNGKRMYTILQINNLHVIRKIRESVYDYKYSITELKFFKISSLPLKVEDVDLR